MTKRCPRCQQLLPLSSFGRNRSRADGVQSFCLRCMRIYKRDHERQRRSTGRVSRNLAAHARQQREWSKANRLKKNAHSSVIRALRQGELTRPGACQRCGTPCRPHAHHADYSKPLEVTWLCTTCHGREHRL